MFVTYQDHHKRLRLVHLLPCPFCLLQGLNFSFGLSGIGIGQNKAKLSSDQGAGGERERERERERIGERGLRGSHVGSISLLNDMDPPAGAARRIGMARGGPPLVA